MKHKKFALALAVALVAQTGLASCQGGDGHGAAARAGALLDLHFDETDGQVAVDASGHAEDATIFSVYESSPTLTAQQGPERRAGVLGNAVLMDGFSTYISYPSSEIILGGESLTISCYIAPRAYDWVDRNAYTEFSNMTGIVSQFYQDSTFAAGVFLGYSREGYLDFRVGTGDSVYSVNSGDSRLAKRRWNYVTAVFDGASGRMALYLDGQLVGEARDMAPGTQISGIAQNLFIGRNPQNIKSDYGVPQGVVSGLLDEVTIYPEVKDEATILETYSAETAEADMGELPYSVIGLPEVLRADGDKPGWHGGPNEHWMNEPHAPCYYNGMYHIFFQHQVNGPYFNGAQGIAWGHLVSTDMVNWHQVDDAITPTLGTVCPDGVWSGGVTYATVDGHENVPCLLFTAGDYVHEGMVSNQNIGLAIPADLDDPYLREWKVMPELAVIQTPQMGVAGEFRDAAVFVEGGYNWLLVGGSLGANHGTAWLFRTPVGDWTNLQDWEFMGSLYDQPDQPGWMGRVWELPAMQPLTDSEGNTTGKYIFLISPAPADVADNNVYYWIGDFDATQGRFIPDWDGDPKRMDFGPNVFTGPNLFIDPVSGLVTISSIAQDQRGSTGDYLVTGWANNMGMYRHLFLREDGNLGIMPVNTSASETVVYAAEDVTIDEANQALADLSSDSLRISVTFTGLTGESQAGVRVRQSPDGREYTEFAGDAEGYVFGDNTTNLRNPSIASVRPTGQLDFNPEGRVELDVYVDRSMIEAFFNDNKTMSLRSYPEAMTEAGLVSLFGEAGATIESIEVATIAPTAPMEWAA